MANQPTLSNPHLQHPILYVDGLASSVQDSDIIGALEECHGVKLNLNRHAASGYSPLSGTIEFGTLYDAEKAYATTRGHFFPQHSTSLSLHLSPPPSQDPLPLAQPRLLKSLPKHFTSGKVFDLCREFGPIFSATLQLAPAFPPGSGPPKFKGQALVSYYEEEDAQRMTEGLHFLEVEGQNIAVAKWDTKRAEKGRRSDISSRSMHSTSSGSSTVQNKAERTSTWANSTTKSYPSSLSASTPEYNSPYMSRNVSGGSQAMSRNVSGASQWSNNTGDTSYQVEQDSPKPSKAKGDGLSIDPCNLFIKSLDPSITSQDLHDLFSRFGEIVSARVMTDSTTLRSKEFGFVSFKEARQADSARREMDGKLVGSKFLTVRLHEPKKLRETRLGRGGGSSEGQVENGSEGRGGRGSENGIELGIERLTTSDQPTSALSPAQSAATPAVADSSTVTEDSTNTPPLSEHERLVAAVMAINPAQTIEIVELIEGLPKKERVMCLFNPEVLRQKVQDALLILEAAQEEEAHGLESAPGEQNGSKDPVSTQSLPGNASIPATIPELAQLPAKEILPLLPAATPLLNLSKPSSEELEKTKRFMHDLDGLPIGQMKQKLGEKLFKVVKRTGIKRAPKITIDLLDAEDLQALSVLMSYPEILKEKAILLSTTPTST